MKQLIERFVLAVRYLKNNRVAEYEKIIRCALDHGYKVVSLHDYYNDMGSEGFKSKKFLVLRHDVDHISPGTLAMAEVEKRLGVSASYYFRKSSEQDFVIDELVGAGFEVSVHFETIADFVKKNNIKNKQQLFKVDFIEVCVAELESHLKWFREKYNVDCKTIASHGERENVLVETPNNYLTEDDTVYCRLGIDLEAYKKEVVDSFDSYISDTVIEINNGYRYGSSPIDEILKGSKKILFLTHPNHWKYDFKSVVRKIIKSFLVGNKKTNDKFKRI